jgi:enoyl-CoA hydratase/carnithine racemase
MDYRHVRLETEGKFAILTMCRPERRNALSEAHLRELRDAIEHLRTSDLRGLVIAAEGPVFSAGHDFADMAGRDLAGIRQLLAVCEEVMTGLQAMPQVTIAQVEGLATAAGCQLVSSCDLAVCGESSQFAVPGGKGGLFCTTPAVGLVRAVGRKHALEMLLTGDPIGAREALAYGLVNCVVADAEVPKATRELLERATRGSALSKALGKQTFYRQVDLDVRSAYAYAIEVMAAASQTPDAQENIHAFLEKRAPRFTR